eukprot:540434-Alexandrium_andersonii.AAC.1
MGPWRDPARRIVRLHLRGELHRDLQMSLRAYCTRVPPQSFQHCQMMFGCMFGSMSIQKLVGSEASRFGKSTPR